MTVKTIDVAAAVMQKTDGSFLLAQRPAGKVYEGYWEFPGGKIETGETPAEALRRELDEELGVFASRIYPWLTRVYTYPHATVRLHFQRVTEWRNEPSSREAQSFSWQQPGEITVTPMLPANAPILKALELPIVYGITNALESGPTRFLARLDSALERGMRLVQLREKHLSPEAIQTFLADVVERCHAHGAKVVVNTDMKHDSPIPVDGVHLTARHLLQCSYRPDVNWCGASCHDEFELDHAEALGLDFVVLGPVHPTQSHPLVSPLGWERFAQLAHCRAIPIYALGGLGYDDLETAWQHGAHGVAMMRAAWRD